MAALDDMDDLDGCAVTTEDILSTDEEVEYLPLFPDGVEEPAEAEAWRELFNAVPD